jgi:hypothetical protein
MEEIMTEIGSIYNDDGKRVARYVPKGPKMNEQNWNYTSTHGESCAECAQATRSARTYATVTGSVASTYTLEYPEGVHSGTATRSQ